MIIDRDNFILEFTPQDIYGITEGLKDPDEAVRYRAAKKLAALALTATQNPEASQRLAGILDGSCALENNLTERDRHFEALFQHAPDGIIYFSFDTQMTNFNPAFAKMHGYSFEEMQALSLQDLDVEDLSELIPERLLRAKAGEELTFEVQHFNKDGQIIHLEVTQCYVELNGEDYTVAFHRDITERRRIELALRESESHFRALFEKANDGIIYVTPDAKITNINRAFAEMHGYSLEEMQTDDLQVQDLAVGDVSQIVTERLQRGVAGERLTFEVQHRHKDGRAITLEVTECVVYIGNDPYVVGFHRDITERKVAEAALMASEQNYHDLINGMQDTAWVIEMGSGKIIDINRATQDSLGYGREELMAIGLEGVDSTYSKDEITAMVEAMPKDRLQVFETTHKAKDGTAIPVEICSSIITYHGQEAILCVARNITERKKAEAALMSKTATIEATIEASSGGILVVNDEKSSRFIINRRYIEMFGIPPEALQDPSNRALLDHITNLAIDPEKFRNDVMYLNSHPNETRREEIEFKDGLIIDRYTAPVIGQDGAVHGRIYTFHDITSRKHMEEELRESSIKDPLTDLYNRRFFEEKVMELEKTRRRQFPISAIYVDIDGLKPINDNWGHDAGDLLIKRAGQVLAETFRPEDCVARMGGDEFAVLLGGVEGAQLQGLVDRLNANVAINNQKYPGALLSISVGTATAPDSSCLRDAIITADNNMLAAKQAKGPSRSSR